MKTTVLSTSNMGDTCYMQSHLTFNFILQHSILVYSKINCQAFIMSLINGS